ncbi:MAG: hypothetical protein WDZ35_13465 [Crocinitomicaceae bacterium]
MGNMDNRSKHEIIERAIAAGIVGAALGALLTGKSKGALAAGIVGAAIGASIKAQKEAKQFELSYLYEENGKIYRAFPDGSREFVKRISRSGRELNIPSTFTLE